MAYVKLHFFLYLYWIFFFSFASSRKLRDFYITKTHKFSPNRELSPSDISSSAWVGSWVYILWNRAWIDRWLVRRFNQKFADGILAHRSPFSTAASAFMIEEPAAPITAGKKSYVSKTVHKHIKESKRQLTIMAQGDKFDIKYPALIFSHTPNANCIAPL